MKHVAAMLCAGILLMVGIGYILYGTVPHGGMPVGITLQAAGELRNATVAGFNVNYTVFSARSASDCYPQQISACDNNEPSQFVCANKYYSTELQAQYSSIYANSQEICPLFMVEGRISCAVSGGYCAVTDNNSARGP